MYAVKLGHTSEVLQVGAVKYKAQPCRVEERISPLSSPSASLKRGKSLFRILGVCGPLQAVDNAVPPPPPMCFLFQAMSKWKSF